MNIKILDSWLKDYLITDAKPEAIGKYLSLCGPSVERIEKIGNDFVYNIEITTNRIDEVGVYGIAREASAILPRFGIKASLKPIRTLEKEFSLVKNVDYLKTVVDVKLCPRFSAVLIKNVKIGDSPDWMKKRLESAGVRSLNNVVDISNYIMLELGQPVHTFDYDKIKGAKMTLRESKKGETIKTLDGKSFKLSGGDIVIEDGKGELIDLCGIMGGSLSAVDANTKNVLLFVQTYDGGRIRKTSMAFAQRTMAASIFEKGTDTELVGPAILSAIDLFKDLTGGIPEKNIIDIYPSPYKTKTIKISLEFIEERLGVAIPKKDITSYLNTLEFESVWKKNILTVNVPSFRSHDVLSTEDILEEIARIYGYHNLPSRIMDGEIPTRPADPRFSFERELKEMLLGWGGTEVYTLSLVPKEYVDEKSLKLKNPLGTDYEYLRTSLMPSLVSAATGNLGTTENFHLFEMANVYLPRRNQMEAGIDLPDEKLMLGGIFFGYSYREAKGIVEALTEKLHIKADFMEEDSKGFDASKCAIIKSGKEIIGKIGIPENVNFIYYEFDVEKLEKISPAVVTYKEIPKYPAQIEDVTLAFPAKTRVGEVIDAISNSHGSEPRSFPIFNVELKDIYKDSYTFRIWYQDPEKTLTNEDVEKIRNEILEKVKEKFGGVIKT
jgi:phenylalanyl-tRNA synthetase beta chain